MKTTTSITTVSADGSVTRSEITGVKKLTTKDLAALGLKQVNRKAAAELRDSGAYVPAGASPELLTVMATCAKNAKQAAKAGKLAATALALAEESGEYKILHGEDGKLYSSFGAFCESMLPDVSDTTRKSYLNAARTIYLPAARGQLEPGLEMLAELEPGTALSACGALNDAAARKRLPIAIANVMKGKKRLTQSMLKKAASIARDVSLTDCGAPGTIPADATPTETTTAPTAPTADTPTAPTADTPTTPTADTPTAPTADTPTVDMAAAVYSAIVRIFTPELYDPSEGKDPNPTFQLTMATTPDEYKDMFAMLKAACDNGESALLFCKMFRQAISNAVKSK